MKLSTAAFVLASLSCASGHVYNNEESLPSSTEQQNGGRSQGLRGLSMTHPYVPPSNWGSKGTKKIGMVPPPKSKSGGMSPPSTGGWPMPPSKGGSMPPPPKGGSKGGAGWPMPPGKGEMPPPPPTGAEGGWPMPPGKGESMPPPPPPGGSKGGNMPPPGKGWPMPPPPGKGGAPSPAPVGKGAPSYCTVIPVILFKTDLKAGYFTDAVGFGYNEVPFYNPQNGQQLGTFSQTVTNIPNSTECVGTSAYSFDYDSTLGLYRSQINTASTCNGQMNAITGGSGSYGCASGYDVFQYEDSQVYSTNLYICQALCPYVFKIGVPNPTTSAPPAMAPVYMPTPTMPSPVYMPASMPSPVYMPASMPSPVYMPTPTMYMPTGPGVVPPPV